ncbi:MAG: PQQ-binding-like beta-propeller repeat protein [Candidatus Methanoperedens sp.]|nr:PQQ-binding-like beta-propeller repeat protein [Candidatus Methanoperedens sp.]MCZ7403889.1 PQQ-binding-like beta-propeller repeat protein [Candidatus Methanoperedens sp.]
MEYIPIPVVIRIAIAASIPAILLLIGSAGALPVEEWNMTFGEESDNDIGYLAQQTSDTGYIIAGETNQKALLIKTDSKGKEQWDMKFARGRAVFVKQTSDGGYYLIGETTQGGGPHIGLKCNGETCGDIWLFIDDIWLAKTDARGKEQWNKTIRKKYSNGDPGFDVQQTADGGYILATTITSYGDNYIINNGWLIKIDREGNEQWSKSFGGAGNIIYSVQQTSDGGYIFSGNNGDAWLVKIDAKGNELWNKTFGGINEDSAYFVQLDNDGSYIIGGSTKYRENNRDGWFIKLDANGNEQWNRTFGGPDDDYIMAARQTLDGGYILLGRKYQAAWLIKTNSDGDEQWNKTFGGKNLSYSLNSIQQTIDGGYILTGGIASPSGYNDVWVLKIKGEQNEAAEESKEIPTEKTPGFVGVMVFLALLTVYMFGGKILRLN